MTKKYDKHTSFFAHILSALKEDVEHLNLKKKFSVKEQMALLRSINLPDGIRQKVFRQYIAAAAVLLLALYLTIFYRHPIYMAGSLLSAALVILAIQSTLHYGDGHICEVTLVCTSVQYKVTQKITHLVFKTIDDNASSVIYYYPGKGSDLFHVDCRYLIYYDERDPFKIVGFAPL